MSMGLFGFGKKKTTFEDALSFYSKRQYKKALAVCDELEDAKQGSFELRNLKGDILFKINKKDDAVNYYKQLIDSLVKDAYYERAIAIIKKMLRNAPERGEFRDTLAQVYGEKGLVAEKAKIYMEIAREYEASKNFDDYVRVMDEVLETEPNDKEFYFDYVSKLEQIGKFSNICNVAGIALEKLDLSDDEAASMVEKCIDNDCEEGSFIKYIPAYIKVNPDETDKGLDMAEKYLSEEIDKGFISELMINVKKEKMKPFLDKLSDKHKCIVVYGPLFNMVMADGDEQELDSLIEKVESFASPSMPDEFPPFLLDLAGRFENPEKIEKLAHICGKAHAEVEKVKIFEILKNRYQEEGNEEKVAEVEKFLYGTSYSSSSAGEVPSVDPVYDDSSDMLGDDEPEGAEEEADENLNMDFYADDTEAVDGDGIEQLSGLETTLYEDDEPEQQELEVEEETVELDLDSDDFMDEVPEEDDIFSADEDEIDIEFDDFEEEMVDDSPESSLDVEPEEEEAELIDLDNEDVNETSIDLEDTFGGLDDDEPVAETTLDGFESTSIADDDIEVETSESLELEDMFGSGAPDAAEQEVSLDDAFGDLDNETEDENVLEEISLDDETVSSNDEDVDLELDTDDFNEDMLDDVVLEDISDGDDNIISVDLDENGDENKDDNHVSEVEIDESDSGDIGDLMKDLENFGKNTKKTEKDEGDVKEVSLDDIDF